MNDLVSILIPVFNRGEIIAETLTSALAQTHQNIEVIVVDNASTDDTWQVIEQFVRSDNRLRAFRNSRNVGPVRNWRRCVEEANGPFAKILWSDDLISDDFIEKCLPLLDEQTSFVYSGVKIFTENPEDGDLSYVIGETGHRPTSEFITRALLNDNVPVSPGCAIFRLEDVKKNLLVDIDTKVASDFSMHAIGNDLLLFLLTAQEYSTFAVVAEPLSFFRAHADSISIASNSGKLVLHYMLVRAYFAEHYRADMINKLAAVIWVMLKKHPDSCSFGINSVNDFFRRDVAAKPHRIAITLMSMVFRQSRQIIRKLYCALEAKA